MPNPSQKEARREVQKSMVGYSMPKVEVKSQSASFKQPKEEPIHARELAKKQREISIAEFFEKNRHLLGFDNPRKALLTTIKEAVDNALDACEEARILPEVTVELIQLGETRFRIIIEDNGPGIVKQQIPKIFAKLLYGSKFYKLSQSRGQQGMGISAAVLYAQLTTGKPALITSKTDAKSKAAKMKLKINTSTNEPEIIEETQVDWPEKEHGTKIEVELEGTYQKGRQSVDEYLKETAIVNPHITIIYVNPEAQQTIFPRAINDLPALVKEIQPHPYGIELGILIKMLENTSSRTVQSFLTDNFSRVSPAVAKEICENSAVLPNTKPHDVTREIAERLIEGIKKTKIIAPPTDCISPIGEEQLEKGLRKGITAEFYCATTRPAAVYRGNPFVIEVAIAYGGELPKDETVRVLRFANRVPLLYQPGACAVSESINDVAWKSYGLEQSRSSPPVGPCVIIVHISSVWVPFTSESKEAIAHYPEIIKEIKLGLQECGRLLGIYVRKKSRIHEQMARANMFEKFLPELAESLASLAKDNKEKILKALQKMLVKPEIKQEILSGGEEDQLYKIELNDKEEKKDEMQEEN